MALSTELEYPLVQYPLANDSGQVQLDRDLYLAVRDMYLAIIELQRGMEIIQRELVLIDARITALEP